MKIFLLVAFVFTATVTSAQVINTAVMDTTDFRYQGKVTVEGYIDAYYAYDFNEPGSKDRPYFVSMARHNEVTINLAFIDLKYNSSRLRARFVPGFGSYINSNYAAEDGSLKNIVEASAGVRLFKNKNIWVDAGVLGSPHTNESAISKDHLVYTRSFAAEYVPYYLSGVRLFLPLSSKVNAYVSLLNGWQQIEDQNNSKSVGTQIEYRPNDFLLISWNTYTGNEKSDAAPQNRMRYFSDIFFIYSKNKFSATGCAYYGIQQRSELKDAAWWQVNLIGKYDITPKTSVSGRVEYFNDPELVQIVPITGVNGFRSYGSSFGVNFILAENVLVRVEYRAFFSDKEVYERESVAVKNSNLLTSNITIWF